jgi:type I restriction enzyme, S subunit
MRDEWKRVPLSDVATLDVETVSVSEGEKYRFAGVYNAGKGLFDRGFIAAEETAYPRLHVLRPERIVMRKLTASEGPITVVPQEFDGFVVSPEFPTFRIDAGRLSPAYMALMCQRSGFWKELEDRSTGSVQRRKRVSPSQLLSIPILLPGLPDQRRISDLIRALDEYIDRCKSHAAAAGEALQQTRTSCFRPTGRAVGRLDAVADVRIGRQRTPKHETGDNMTPYLRSANVKDGRLDLSDVMTMNFTPTEQVTFALQDGDVLVSEGSASERQVGSSAVWHGELPGAICFQNTLIRLRGASGGYSPPFLYHWARWAYQAGLLASIASGTNIKHIGSQRMASMLVPIFDQDAQRDWCEILDDLQVVEQASRGVVDAAVTARTALLDDLLEGRHPIPESYDALLS